MALLTAEAERIHDSFIPSSLVPSQVFMKSANADVKDTNRNRRKKRKKKKKYVRQPLKANVWSYIPEDHLRAHPLYFRLPIAGAVRQLQSYSNLSKFRQSSSQWSLMHNGRLTTSRAAGATGMLENKFAEKLGIPRSLSGNGKARQSYFHLLGETEFTSLKEAEEALIVQDVDQGRTLKKLILAENEKIASLQIELWTQPKVDKVDVENDHKSSSSSKKFAYQYMVGNSNSKTRSAVNVFNKYNRMAYGNIQEPTAILVALNYFYKHGFTVHECGMFPGEALLEKRVNGITSQSNSNATDSKQHLRRQQLDMLEELLQLGCRIGASPDGLIINSKNKNDVQALEVKNHLSLSKQAYATFDTMSTWYVVQLQLEMFCIGPHCKSAILVRLSSTKGAVIFKMKRDDEYILMMLQRFKAFYTNYVINKTPPPPNFGRNSKVLANFVNRTKEIANSKCSIVKRIWPKQVQRSPHYYSK